MADRAPIIASDASRSPSPNRITGVATTLSPPDEWNDSTSELERKATERSANSSRQSGLSKTSTLASAVSQNSGNSSNTILGRKESNASRPSTSDSYSKFETSTTDFSDAAIMSDEDQELSGSRILGRDDVFPSTVEGRKPIGPRSFTEQRAELKPSSSEHPSRSPSSELPSDARAQGAFLETPSIRPYNGSEVESSDDGHRRHGIQDVVKLPLRSAAGIVGWVKNRSKKATGVLAGGSMTYLEKVTDMWSGGRHHYNEPMGMMPEEQVDEDADDGDALEHGNRFRQRFALPSSERLVSVYFAYLHRVIPVYGKIYLGSQHICFRSIIPGTKTKVCNPTISPRCSH